MAECVGAACNFARDYEIAQEPLMREIERCVRGSDYGATSWTTRTQAEQAAARLELGHGLTLLELGAGSGWPALFLATLSGCDAVLTDLPLSGLRVARERAARDGVDGHCCVLAADGTALPFANGSFDRIHHADVLCCMDDKRAMLQECRRVARADARMEFSVIALVRQPDEDVERQLLGQSGPPYPDAGADYAVLLADTGWSVLERIDVTAEFVRCMEVLLEASHARRDALIALLGEADHAERLERRRSTLEAVARGLLRREIFLVQLNRAP
jgi:SAM-dependent methyltransferase